MNLKINGKWDGCNIKTHKAILINGWKFIEYNGDLYSETIAEFVADLRVRIKRPIEYASIVDFHYFSKVDKSSFYANNIKIEEEVKLIDNNIFKTLGANSSKTLAYIYEKNNKYILNIIKCANTKSQLRQGCYAIYGKNFRIIDWGNYVDSCENISWHKVVSKVYSVSGLNSLNFSSIYTEILGTIKNSINGDN